MELYGSLFNISGSVTASAFTGSYIGDGAGLYNLPASGVTGLNLSQITSGNATASISSTAFTVNKNTQIQGNLSVTGSIIATEYIVSSSVTYMTTSFASGSTAFGNDNNDVHQFTGSVQITGSISLNGQAIGTGKLDETTFQSYTSSNDGRVSALETSSGSLNSFTSSINTTIKSKLDADGVISGSVQVNITGTTGYSTFSSSISSSILDLSSSVATTTLNTKNKVDSIENKTGSYATTGSNLFIGTQTHSGSILPSVDNTYDLGSPTYQWRDVYISSGSLYIDGTKVLGSTSQEITITTDTGQSIKILESGSDSIILQSADGDIELKSSGGGDILFDPTNGIISIKGTTQIQDGFKINSSGGTNIVFGDSIIVSGSVELTGNVDGIDLQSFSSSVSASISSLLGGNTSLSSSIATTTSGLSSSIGSLSSSVATTTNDLSSSVATTTLTTKNRVDSIETTTGSLNTFTSSASGRLTSLETASGSIRTDFNTYTGSNNTVIGTLQTSTGSLNTFTSSLLTAIELTGSNITIKGNLLVKGTTTNVNVATLDVDNNLINLNGSGASFAGLRIKDATQPNLISGSFLWDSSNDYWIAGPLGSEQRIVRETEFNNSVTRIGNIETATASLNSFTSSINTTIKNKLNSDGVVSGSSQVSFNGITDKPTLVSGSSQITYGSLSGIPSGIVSGSSQITFGSISSIPSGLVSGSSQISIASTSGFGTYINQALLTTSTPTFSTVSATTFTGALSGNATTATTAGALTSMNISQFTNNSGYLTSITSGNVTTALGFTPYNATNPSGYITGISFANVSSKPTTLSGYGITDALPLAGGTMTGTITITSTDIRSNATSNWTGDPGVQGKIQYHSNRWYIVSDSSSDRIVQFRRNGTDTSWIANDGTFNGSITGNAATAGGFTPSQTSGTANRIVVADANGYIVNNYFNASGGGSERNASGMGYFAGHNTSDYYYRSYTAAAAAALLSGQAMNISGNATTATSTQRLDDVNNYTWSSSTLPASYSEGMQLSFVGPNAGEGSWQNYGTVINARTYSGGGGSLQIYVPYGPSNGGDSLQVRFGNYNVSSGNSWTGWKTLIDSGTIGSQSVSYASTAGSTGTLSSNAVTNGYVVIGGNYSNNAFNNVGSTRLMFGGGNGDAVDNYYIGTNLEDYGGNYTKLDLRWHTGIRMGAQASYGGIRFYNNEDLSSVLFSIGASDGNVRSHTNLLPSANNSYNLGSTSLRWANLYTNDLHLSNEGKEGGNEIDGTTGDWTIQEGEENLYIINHKNGKKFKIDLTEIV